MLRLNFCDTLKSKFEKTFSRLQSLFLDSKKDNGG